MKLLGAASVMLSCTTIALILVSAERRALRALNALCLALAHMRAELTTRLCPTKELLYVAACAAEGETAAFFFRVLEGMDALSTKSFEEIWKEAAGISLPTQLEAEKAALIELGASLGRYELQVQLAAIDRFLLLGQTALDERRRALPDKRRLIIALSETAGFFLCLLLL